MRLAPHYAYEPLARLILRREFLSYSLLLIRFTRRARETTPAGAGLRKMKGGTDREDFKVEGRRLKVERLEGWKIQRSKVGGRRLMRECG